VKCFACSAGQPYCSAKFLSLRTGDEVHNIPYTEPITDIRANDRYAGSVISHLKTDVIRCHRWLLHHIIFKMLNAITYRELIDMFRQYSLNLHCIQCLQCFDASVL